MPSCFSSRSRRLMLFTRSFEAVLDFIQFALLFCSFFTVLGVIKLRITQPDLPRPYRAWGYPVTPVIFLLVTAFHDVLSCRRTAVAVVFRCSDYGFRPSDLRRFPQTDRRRATASHHPQVANRHASDRLKIAAVAAAICSRPRCRRAPPTPSPPTIPRVSSPACCRRPIRR